MREAERRDAGLEADLDLIRGAAIEAGRIAMRYFGKKPEVWLKGGHSPVSEADLSVDRFLRRTLLEARPDYGWLSEETADSPDRLRTHRLFVVDPIDGTRAFIAGRDIWCISIGIVEAGRSIAGVLECPARSEHYHALPGRGACLNDAAIRVREPGTKPLVGGPKTMLDKMPASIRATVAEAAYVPSLAYRVAMIAKGALDASFIKPNAHDWDLAAADLILQEAGGSLLDAGGERPDFGGAEVHHGALVAGSGALLRELSRTLAG